MVSDSPLTHKYTREFDVWSGKSLELNSLVSCIATPWTCKAYCTVVDVYIPYKKSKAGKRFAFVRFIKVKNLDRLVANLCTIWIGSYHLQVNIVRYQRERKTYDTQNSFKRNVGISSNSFKGNVGNYSNSFASVLKYGKQVTEATRREEPSLVLDDTCFSDIDFNLSLMGKVKDITALPNLYVILKEECFQNFKISYLGGIDERIMWISIEGLPLKVWSFNTFVKVASNWGELVEWKNIEDNNFSHKQLCVKTKLNEIICERFKVIVQGNVHWVRAKEMEGWDSLLHNEDYASSSSDEENEQENEGSRNGEKYDPDKEVNKVSESSCMQGDALFYDHDNNKSKESNVQSKDPFNIYDLLNKNKESDGNSKEGELKYPLGLGHKTKKRWIKELCTKNRVNFVSLQEKKMEHIELVTINKLWGNSSYDYAFSSSLVRSEHEWYGSVFNVQSAAAFNNFISLASLIDLPLDGYAYTWVHKFATKMSKLDQFLISKGLMASFPHLSAICLDKHLSDHRPILMREMNINYGPTPFRFFHSWFQIEGNGSKSKSSLGYKGDENSKYFHGIQNNKCSHLAIRGVLVNGDWIVKPNYVKNEFLNQFSSQFDRSVSHRIYLADVFNNQLSLEQQDDLERNVSIKEIKRAVWDCGTNKSPGPDGFTFELF
nr:hypothetical protein [Tanacetum cinerariifolium]